jgi:hypothetical protein
VSLAYLYRHSCSGRNPLGVERTTGVRFCKLFFWLFPITVSSKLWSFQVSQTPCLYTVLS